MTDVDVALEQANKGIRDAAKWMVASAAAVGAALIAGSQLSSIGRLPVDWPTSIVGARLWVAALGAMLGLSGVIFAIWTAVAILLPKLVLVNHLDAAWADPRSALRPVVEFFAGQPKYLQGFDSPGAVIAARDRLINALAEAGSDKRAEDAANLTERIGDLDARITAIEQMASHEALKDQFHRALRKLLTATVVAALGIVSFAWAANPPEPPAPSANMRGASLVGAQLRDADLRGATLDGADLTDADLTGADLTGASIIGVVWRRTMCPDGTISDAVGGTCAGHLSRK